MAEESEKEIFYRQQAYPDARGIISWSPQPLETIKEIASVVVDTNALLVPFGTGKASLEEIGEKYRSLIAHDRLVIPGQVIREYASNRVVKLQELHQQLMRKKQLAISGGTYPLLEGMTSYLEMTAIESQLEGLLKTYKSVVEEVLKQIRHWHWNDPVSVLYKNLFNEQVVLDPAFDRAELKDDLNRRFSNGIPPGYKDSRKDDGGIGDLIIWRTILEVGKTRKTPLLFVSGDQKADWWHQSEGMPLYPRFELIDEYRRESGGQTLHLITFSRFLDLVGASPTIVAEVRKEEAETFAARVRRALVTPTAPTAEAKVPPSLSEKARELLVAASEDPAGIILKLEMLAGSQVATNGRQFIVGGDPRSSARWRATVDELCRLQLIEDRAGKGEVFSVTEEGYRVADLLKQATTPTSL